nr:hypothetical protein KUHPSE09_00320 [Staphylococcus epidermidis]
MNDLQGAFIVVSHDREFLDNVCTSIWEIRDGNIIQYPGNYNNYLQQKEVENRQEQLEYENIKTKKAIRTSYKIKRNESSKGY